MSHRKDYVYINSLQELEKNWFLQLAWVSFLSSSKISKIQDVRMKQGWPPKRALYKLWPTGESKGRNR